MTRKDWIERFVARMIDRAGFDHFDDGTLVLDYAEETAVSYFETDWQRDMGPEDCADADISYWGDA